MERIDFVLIGDGTSDRCLIPVLRWLLRRFFSDIPINGEWAEITRYLPRRPTLSQRIIAAVELYFPDILFIHRDAEAQEPQLRYDEISRAVQQQETTPYICVVPVRMTEAWFLFDEAALRKAAGNPNGHVQLDLPPIHSLESIPDPKSILFETLLTASELRGRHRKRFNPDKCCNLIAENIYDYSPLMALGAFQRLAQDIENFA
jgi:hypothetical protein